MRHPRRIAAHWYFKSFALSFGGPPHGTLKQVSKPRQTLPCRTRARLSKKKTEWAGGRAGGLAGRRDRQPSPSAAADTGDGYGLVCPEALGHASGVSAEVAETSWERYGQSPYKDSGFQRAWLKHKFNYKGWNSHVHRESVRIFPDF